jgi:hypothetical protein
VKNQYPFWICLLLSVAFCVTLTLVGAILIATVFAVMNYPLIAIGVVTVFIVALAFYYVLNDFGSAK